jgi:hypothetical protein
MRSVRSARRRRRVLHDTGCFDVLGFSPFDEDPLTVNNFYAESHRLLSIRIFRGIRDMRIRHGPVPYAPRAALPGVSPLR